MASVTFVVGVGAFPTHATLQFNEQGQTTYFGFGPKNHFFTVRRSLMWCG
jgi:hypothetical protein